MTGLVPTGSGVSFFPTQRLFAVDSTLYNMCPEWQKGYAVAHKQTTSQWVTLSQL